MKYSLILYLVLLVWGCQTQETADTPPEAPAQEEPAEAPAPEAPSDAPDFSATGLEAAEVSDFFDALKEAVRRDDREAVAALVAYPVTVQIQGQPTTVENADDFVARYSAIMNERIRGALRAQPFTDLFSNWQGVRVGRGELWFSGVYEEGEEAYELKIIAINNE